MFLRLFHNRFAVRVMQISCLMLAALIFPSHSESQEFRNFSGISSNYEKNTDNPYEKRRRMPTRVAGERSGPSARPLPTLPSAKAAPPPRPPASRARVASAPPPPLPLLDVTSTAIRPKAARSAPGRLEATPSISLRSRPGYVNSVNIPSVQAQPLPQQPMQPPMPETDYAAPSLSMQPLPPSAPPVAVPPAQIEQAFAPAANDQLPPLDAVAPEPAPAYALPPLEPPVTEPPAAEPSVAAIPAPQPFSPSQEVPYAAPPASEVAELPVASSAGDGADARFFTPDPSQPPVSGDVASGAAPAEQLSEETRAILSSLPADALPRPVPMPSADVKGDFAIKRAIDPGTPFSTSATPPVPSANGEATMDIRMKPQSIDVNYELERAYNALVSGDTDMAIHLYEQVLSMDPSEKTALFGLATTYHRIGLLDQARPVYGRLLAVDPYNVEALNNFFALVGAEAPHAAIEQLELLAYDNPEFAPIQAQIALLYQKLGDYPNAISHMSRAAIISPENLAYKYNLAVLYDTNEQYDQAERIYRYLLTLYRDGQELPASPKAIQERLTFLASN